MSILFNSPCDFSLPSEIVLVTPAVIHFVVTPVVTHFCCDSFSCDSCCNSFSCCFFVTLVVTRFPVVTPEDW